MWLHATGERPANLAVTLDYINPTLYLYPVFPTMPVSTAIPDPERSIRRVKTYPPAATRTERLSAHALITRTKTKPWTPVSFAERRIAC